MKPLVIGMLAHVDAGKTTLSEALLYRSGVIRTPGRVDRGDSYLDTDSMERKRGITIYSKQARFRLPNTDVTLLDTPGHVDFSAETERTLQVLDCAILVISGTDGIQSHTETLWYLLRRYRIPTLIFINKADLPAADCMRVYRSLRARLSNSVCCFSSPDGAPVSDDGPLLSGLPKDLAEDLASCDEELLTGYLESEQIDETLLPELIRNRTVFPCFFGSALRFQGIDCLLSAIDRFCTPAPVSEEFGARVFKITRDARGNRLTHMKITGGVLRAKQFLQPGLSQNLRTPDVPSDDSEPDNSPERVEQIRLYSGEHSISVPDASAGMICTVTGLTKSMPGTVYGAASAAPEPFLEPVLSYRLILPPGIDAAAVLPKLRILEEEKPELHIVWDELAGELTLQVMGLIQQEILRAEILSRFDLDVSFGPGRIVYKETIASFAEGVGHFEPLRHYAEVHLRLSPLPAGSGLLFDTDCSEDELAGNWQRLVLTHLRERRHRGVLTGAPITDLRITLISGRAHIKHTEGGDFRQATYRAVRQGLMQANSVLLEPYFSFRLTVPQDCIGRAMSDLQQMKARFTLDRTGSSDSDGPLSHSAGSTVQPSELRTSDYANAVITGLGPVSELTNYPAVLAAYTGGLGRLFCEPAGYLPCHNADDVIADIGYDPERDLGQPTGSVFCANGSGFVVPWYEVPMYMHLPFRLNTSSADFDNIPVPHTVHTESSSDGPSLGTEEIDEILRKATHANKRSDNRPVHAAPAETRIYKGTEHKQNTSVRYLLVDGYNIIHAWPELEELSRVSYDAARGRLLDIMCNYQAISGYYLIVVFDAYRVKGHDTEYSDYHNIHVVFTKEAETADRYIERFTHEVGHRYFTRVATSDGLEQIIIRGQGCYVTSARELEAEVLAAEARLREEYLS